MSYETLAIERRGAVATIWMDRPAVFNAFNEQLIAELAAACAELDADANPSPAARQSAERRRSDRAVKLHPDVAADESLIG